MNLNKQKPNNKNMLRESKNLWILPNYRVKNIKILTKKIMKYMMMTSMMEMEKEKLAVTMRKNKMLLSSIINQKLILNWSTDPLLT